MPPSAPSGSSLLCLGPICRGFQSLRVEDHVASEHPAHGSGRAAGRGWTAGLAGRRVLWGLGCPKGERSVFCFEARRGQPGVAVVRARDPAVATVAGEGEGPGNVSSVGRGCSVRWRGKPFRLPFLASCLIFLNLKWMLVVKFFFVWVVLGF